LCAGENKTVAQHAIIKDLFDLTAADLAGFDVVVDAFGAWTPETFPQHSTSLKHLADVLSGADARLIVVGGAGSLYVNPEHTVQLSQTDGFPEGVPPARHRDGALHHCLGRGCAQAVCFDAVVVVRLSLNVSLNTLNSVIKH